MPQKLNIFVAEYSEVRLGYRVSTISKMLGHSNTQITESTYVMFEDNAVIDEARIISDSI